MNKEKTLSSERKKFKDDLDYALGKFNWGQSALDAKAIKILNEWKIVLDNQDKEFLKNIDEDFLDDWTNANGKTFTLDEIREIIKNRAGKDLI